MAAQYTVLLPRPMPSKRGQKYDSKRLYIILLLLLLAGDVEMNPGPRNLSQNTKDEGVRARSSRRHAAAVAPAEQCPPARSAAAAAVVPAEQCPPERSAVAATDAPAEQSPPARSVAAAVAAPGERCSPARSAVAAVDASGRVPPAGLERCPPARSAAAAAVAPAEQSPPARSAAAAAVASDRVPPAGLEQCPPARSADAAAVASEEQSPPARSAAAAADAPAEQCPSERSVAAAVDASDRVPPAGLEQCPPARSADAAANAQSRLPISTNAANAWDLTHTEPEAIPGPSFTSVSLMDVMEGLRRTQLKVDKVSDELGEMKHLLHVLLRQQTQTPATSFGSDPPVSDRRDDHTIQDDVKGNENVRSQSPGEPGLLVVGDSNVRRLRLCNTRANISFRSIPGAATHHVEREVQVGGRSR